MTCYASGFALDFLLRELILGRSGNWMKLSCWFSLQYGICHNLVDAYTDAIGQGLHIKGSIKTGRPTTVTTRNLHDVIIDSITSLTMVMSFQRRGGDNDNIRFLKKNTYTMITYSSVSKMFIAHILSASHKCGILELKESYAHVVLGPTRRNQGAL